MPVISSWTFSFIVALIWCSVLLGNHLFTPLKATDLPHRWVYGDAPAPHLTSSDVFLTARNPDLNVHQDSSQKLRKNVIIWSSLGCPLSSFQLLSRVRLFVIPWIAARQASLSITNSRSSLRLMSIQSVMPSSHLILCCPLLLLLPIPSSIRVFSNESTLHMRWPKYWSFSFSISPSKNTQDWFLEWTGWISLQSKGLSRVFSNTTVQKHQFFGTQLSSQSNSHIHTQPLENHSLN